MEDKHYLCTVCCVTNHYGHPTVLFEHFVLEERKQFASMQSDIDSSLQYLGNARKLLITELESLEKAEKNIGESVQNMRRGWEGDMERTCSRLSQEVKDMVSFHCSEVSEKLSDCQNQIIDLEKEGAVLLEVYTAATDEEFIEKFHRLEKLKVLKAHVIPFQMMSLQINGDMQGILQTIQNVTVHSGKLADEIKVSGDGLSFCITDTPAEFEIKWPVTSKTDFEQMLKVYSSANITFRRIQETSSFKYHYVIDNDCKVDMGSVFTISIDLNGIPVAGSPFEVCCGVKDPVRITQLSVKDQSTKHGGFLATRTLESNDEDWLTEGEPARQWIVYQFASEAIICKFGIRLSSYECTPKNTSLEIRDSVSGEWKSISDFTVQSGLITQAWQYFAIPYAKVKEIRLFCHDRHGPGGGNFILITELAFFGILNTPKP